MMNEKPLGTVELRFAEIIWRHAPLSSSELVRLCASELGWKKSTTYTVIKKLCEKGYIQNDDATVRVLIPKAQAQTNESTYFVERTFDGSLPSFVAAFLGGRTITEEEAKQLRKMIREHVEKES